MLKVYIESLRERSSSALLCADIAIGVFNVALALNYSIPLLYVIGGFFLRFEYHKGNWPATSCFLLQ